MLTEQRNPNSAEIDRASTLELLTIINDEDATVAAAVRQALPYIAQVVDAIAERLRAGGRLFYVGAGTSGRLALLDAVECVPTFGTPPETVQAIIAGGEVALTRAVEGAEDNREQARADLDAAGVSAGDVVVGIAASGRTPYTLAAVEYANEIGTLTVAIACNDPAPLLDAATIKIAALVGPEVITGSTRLKAGTAQKLILNMLSTAVMVKLGKVYGNLMVDVRITNNKLADRARRIVMEISGADDATAASLLQATNNEVKTAIVMHLLGLSAEAARERLSAAQGQLVGVIGQ